MARDGIVGFVRRLVDPVGHVGVTDRELLVRFANGRDEAAFETLVGRYARLVRSAAARVLADPSDIDDAIQATFLVLVRRADREDWRPTLGPWLYGVAHRVAIRLRSGVRRRPGPLGTTDPADPVPPPDPSWREACDLLHAELDRLPDRYRLPLLLCYLEGQTRGEAALALGVTPGAVKGRVRRGCELLRRRLARRGVSLSVGVLAVAAAPRFAVARPSAISAAARGVPAPRVAELTTEITRAMLLTSKKSFVFGLVAACLGAAVGLGAGLNPDPPGQPAPVTAPAPKSAPPSRFLVQKQGLIYLDADGKEKEKIDPAAMNGTLSPDGRRMAALEYDEMGKRSRLVIRARGEKVESVTIPLVFGRDACTAALSVWSADGKRVLISEEEKGGNRQFVHRVYDLAAKSVSDLKLPEGVSVTGWSADGKRFLANVQLYGKPGRVAWLNADGTGKPEFISPDGEVGYDGRLSPDGRRVLYQGDRIPPRGEWVKLRLYAQDLATGKRTAVDEPGKVYGYCWSPDGSRVAYTWQRWPVEVAEREVLLVTCDPDGGNRKTVTSRKYESRGVDRWDLVVIDWR